MGGSHHTDDDYQGDGVPLSDAARTAIIVIHYSTLLACGFAIWALVKKFHVIESRIWSPFLLVTTFTWLQMAAAFEISNHFYIDNWQLYDPKSDLINGSFSFFNFGAQNLLALSLRKKGIKFVRKGTSISEWIAIVCDPILVMLIVVNPIVYGTLGRSTSVTALSPLAVISGVFTLYRVWFNLGPNLYTKLGGIGFLVLAMTGVVMNVVYRSTGAEWVHGLIGGSFISSTIPLTIAFLNSEVKEGDSRNQEEQPLDENQEGEANKAEDMM